MRQVYTTRFLAFSEDSIVEVEDVASLEFNQFDEQETLIESFSDTYPMLERGSPVMDGEMDSYG